MLAFWRRWDTFVATSTPGPSFFVVMCDSMRYRVTFYAGSGGGRRNCFLSCVHPFRVMKWLGDGNAR